MKRDGVPMTPRLLPYSRSPRIWACFSSFSMHWLNLMGSICRSSAIFVRFSGVNFLAAGGQFKQLVVVLPELSLVPGALGRLGGVEGLGPQERVVAVLELDRSRSDQVSFQGGEDDQGEPGAGRGIGSPRTLSVGVSLRRWLPSPVC